MSAIPTGGRLFYMDALRAFCMLFGIMVHGATIGSNPLFTFIKDASDLFRMAAFMVISGFFTAMVARRAAHTDDFYRGRVPILIYPLITTLILLNPVTNWLIQIWHGEWIGFGEWLGGGWRSPPQGNAVWHLHLWFLFSLIVYALLTPLLLLGARQPVVLRALDRYCEITRGWTVWANVLAVGIGVALCRALHNHLIGPLFDTTPFAWIASATMTYLPYFILGLLCFLHRGLFRSLHVLSWWGLAVFTALYLGVGYFGADLPRALERTLFWAAKAGITMLLICGLLYLFERFLNRPSKLLSFLVDASYTFYLFHFLVIYFLVNVLSAIFGDNVYLLFTLIVILGTPLALAIHRFIIAPVPLLRLMFTGKRPKKPQVAAAS